MLFVDRAAAATVGVRLFTRRRRGRALGIGWRSGARCFDRRCVGCVNRLVDSIYLFVVVVVVRECHGR